MSNPDERGVPEYCQEFSSVTPEECQTADKLRPELKARFSAEVRVSTRDGHPNKVIIRAPTEAELENATERYIRACGNA